MIPFGKHTLHHSYVRSRVEMALQEDAPTGDITSEACVDPDARVDARIIAKEEGIVAGTEFAWETFRQCWVKCDVLLEDGSHVKKGDVIIQIRDASARGVLHAERTALNFMGYLSGIATAAHSFVKAVQGTGVTILDTRKTTPGMRLAEKSAVRAGGAGNHRAGLSDAILIKENHIRAAGGIRPAVTRALAAADGKDIPLEVEVTNLSELRDAIEAGAKIVLLDNMHVDGIKMAVEEAKKRGVLTEASGNVSLANVRQIAETGVGYISIGWITHSAPTLDLSLLIDHK